MYTISEIFIIQFLCFFLVLHSSNDIINFLKYKFSFLNYENINKFVNSYCEFVEFISDNNLLLINYLDIQHNNSSAIEEKQNEELTEKKIEDKKQEKYEDKYLERYKKFPNEFSFTELELDNERQEFEKIKIEFEKTRSDSIWDIQQELTKITNIIETGNFRKIKSDNETYSDNINKIGMDNLIKYCDVYIDEDDPENVDFEELYLSVLEKKEELNKKMLELENMIMTEEEMRLKARDITINNKLNKCMDNYILEHTPIGNIYMRYNNDKKSFEYFSNNSIPYRYLEPVGRKYVMTYWCKPIFVDIEEELKKAEEKYDKEKEKKDEDAKQKEEEKINNPKRILAQLKNYNKETKEQTTRPMKNRANKNFVLPPQIKVNMPVINNTSEKQLLKENANRYTWEGRLTSFCPLKKIDRKNTDKKLAMTYADFKKIQTEQQNKK